MSPDPIVTIADVRAVHFCVRGTRYWFELHSMDFRAFLQNGLPCSAFEATGDAMGIAVAQYVRAKNSEA